MGGRRQAWTGNSNNNNNNNSSNTVCYMGAFVRSSTCVNCTAGLAFRPLIEDQCSAVFISYGSLTRGI